MKTVTILVVTGVLGLIKRALTHLLPMHPFSTPGKVF